MVVTIASVLTLHTPPLRPICQPVSRSWWLYLQNLPRLWPLLTSTSASGLVWPPLPRYVLASWPLSCFNTPHVPNMEAKGPFDNGSRVLSWAHTFQRPSNGRQALRDGRLPAPLLSHLPPTHRGPPLRAFALAAPPPQTSTWLTALSSQASAQMSPLPGSPPVTLTLCVPLP